MNQLLLNLSNSSHLAPRFDNDEIAVKKSRQDRLLAFERVNEIVPYHTSGFGFSP
jgi:hypothetical protein